jgi:hypothetical protein
VVNAFEKEVEIPLGEDSVDVVLSGTKESDASLVANDVEVVSFSENSRTWSYTATVVLGDQTISFVAVDIAGNTSSATEVILTGVEDNDAPNPPTVDEYEPEIELDEGESFRTVNFTGTKDSACTLEIEEEAVNGTFGFTSWTASIDLVQGANAFDVTCVDAAGNASEAVVVSIYAIPFLSPPVLSGFPDATNQNPLTISGTKPVATGVELRWEGEMDWASILAADSTEAAEGTFSYSGLQIEEGPNSFYLRSVTTAGDLSASSPIYTVELDVTAPDDPVVTSVVPETFYFAPGETSGELLIEGTKEDGTVLVINGVPEGQSEGTSWQAEVPIAGGTNMLSISVQDTAGNFSSSLDYEIEGVEGLAPPTVVLPEGPVNAAALGAEGFEVSGTRPEGASIWLYFEGEAAAEIVTGSGETWSVSLSIVEGDNVFYIYAADDMGRRSNDVGPNTITLDTIAPNPPLIDQPDPPLVSEELIAITGSKATQDSKVCLQQGGSECIQVVAYSADLPFEIIVQLLEGFNTLCFRSTDLAGNESDCAGGTDGFIVERARAPQVEFVKPAAPAFIATTQVEVRVEAIEERVGGSIEAVEICIVDDCVDAMLAGPVNTWIANIQFETPADGTLYTLTAHATNNLDQVGTGDISLIYTSEPVVISDQLNVLEGSRKVRAAVDSQGRLHAVWQDDCWDSFACDVGTATNGADIFYAAFDGEAWTAVHNISAINGEADSREPDLAIDSFGNVHIVWQDDGNVGGEGNDWDLIHRMVSAITLEPMPSAAIVTTGNTTDDRYPKLGADSTGRVHLVWQRGNCDVLETCVRDIYYASWNDDVWNIATPVTTDANSGDATSPSIAVAQNGEAYIAWQDEPKGNGPTLLASGSDIDIFMRVLDQSFGETILLSDSISDSEGVAIVYEEPTDQNDLPNIHIVWEETNEPQRDVVYRSYTPFTGVFTVTEQLSTIALEGESFYAQSPTVAVDSAADTVYVAWSENSAGVHRVYHAERGPSGMFSASEVLTEVEGDGRSWTPYIVVDPGMHLFVFRVDNRDVDGTGDDYDVYVSIMPIWY